MTNIKTQEYRVDKTFFEQGKPAISALLQLFQDIATEQLEELKLNYLYLEKQGKTWVILQNAIKLFSLPKLGEKLLLKTILYAPNVVDCDREYFLINEQGQTLIYGFSKWCLIDVQTRKITSYQNVLFPIQCKPKQEKGYKLVAFQPNDDNFLFAYQVTQNDIDFNNHMNNVAYGKLVLKALQNHNMNLCEFVINYQKECHKDDWLKIHLEQQEKLIEIVGTKNNQICFVCALK